MAQVKWTAQALGDIDAISEYIARDSKYYARIFVSKVFDSVIRLEVFSESGRIVPEINQMNIREILLGNYRIIYRLKENLIEILTVYHCSRLLNGTNIVGDIP